MTTCPSCGKDLPGEFPFCPFCAAPLTEQPSVPVQEERKVVSVLFCDLVGFTAASEAADPEDVGARIRPYHSRLREELTRFGGTVEKFIGDAVMTVFGAPVAHEDDAERAIRAGLRILEAIDELNEADPGLALQVRIGINTGEAVVALGARPEHGEGLVTGDVVNTASRLQAVAPVNGIAVSEQTYRVTERVFEYEALEPTKVKGKTEPVSSWRPLRARARFGSDVTRTHATALVGRELEKQLLVGTFERSAQQRSCQLVTIVGEPGVGKSRMCAELFQHIDERPELVTWRQGRCLPYGESIAFWALGEIVKAECGILESDSPAQAQAKLERAVPAADPDRVWLCARLSPLVGAPAEPASQEEMFTAWRRFLGMLGSQGPAVLVFEDLHWADPALLSFLGYLADWSEGLPLLLLCTARPELFEQHPTWAAGLRNATTINLAPLTDEETARLIAMLLDRAVLPAETQQALLERAGGNPLYAEEFVRLLSDQGSLPGEAEIPDSVQGLIAARLDTLSPERKSLLQDAAVVGKLFWVGALADMGDRDPGEIEFDLHELARKELVRTAHTSSIEGETEYAFWHLLVRDVCYAQIPRASRVERHRAAAAWLERQAGDRAEDLADVLAYHYLTALELGRAGGRTEGIGELEAQVIHYLALAGERALPLDIEHAEHNLARALELAPVGHPERAQLLERWAQAARQQGRPQGARDALEEALELHRDQRETVAAARVLTMLSSVLQTLGDGSGTAEAASEALKLLEAQPPGPELVALRSTLAGTLSVHSAYTEAIAAAEQALGLAADLGLPEPARALGFRGAAMAGLGQRQGLEDMRRALQLAIEQGQGRAAAVLHSNLALVSWQYDGPQVALEICREALDFCERRGIAEVARWVESDSLKYIVELGQPEQALALAGPLAERMQAAGDSGYVEAGSAHLHILVECGAHAQAPPADELVATVRRAGQPQMYSVTFPSVANLLLASGRPQEAKALLLELDQIPEIRVDPNYSSALPELVRSALGLGDPQLAGTLTAGVESRTPLVQHALGACRAQLAEAAGEHEQASKLYAQAAERWRKFGNIPERAYALLGQGRSLVAVGGAGAEEPLDGARELFASIGYKPALAETEALLAAPPQSRPSVA